MFMFVYVELQDRNYEDGMHIKRVKSRNVDLEDTVLVQTHTAKGQTRLETHARHVRICRILFLLLNFIFHG